MKLLQQEILDAQFPLMAIPSSSFQFGTTVLLDEKSAKLTIVSKCISDYFSGSGDLAVKITERGIWPSAENLFLFRLLTRTITASDEMPPGFGLVFSSAENQEFESLIFLSLHFYWGFEISSRDHSLLLRVDHHSELSALSIDDKVLDHWLKHFERYVVKQ